MRKLPFFIALCFIAGAAMANTPAPFHAGSGPPNVVPSGRDVCWSEPADLNGLIGSSEQIISIGLETELANDFVPTSTCVAHVTWWGGFYNNSTPCASGITTPGFNLKFYDDAGCIPGSNIANVVVISGQFTEVSVGCQAGAYPMFKWDADVAVQVTGGNLYWFGAQMNDHAYPPQAGRLAAAVVTSCDTVFQSAYFGFPDWTPAVDVFGVTFDCSQEITCGDGPECIGPPPPDHEGACCFGSDCRILYGEQCSSQGGQWQGDNTSCDPNPCADVPTKSTTWGKIKGSYR